MSKASIPEIKYHSVDKEMYSLRLPKEMIKKMKAVADKKEWSVTELVLVAIDQYLQKEPK